MRRARWILTGVLWVVWSVGGRAEEPAKKESLFENVARVLSERYFDDTFRENELPALIERYRPRVARASSFDEERAEVQRFLSNIPSTHTALISSDEFEQMRLELEGKSVPMLGLELIEYDGKQYAHDVLEKGPADVAGLKHGDRIVLIDGALPEESPRVGGRTDDAFLPDPPVRPIRCSAGETVKFKVERKPGTYTDLDVPCKPYSPWEAAKASVRVVEQDGKRIGVIHFWLIHLTGPDELLKSVLEGEFASCDALVLDLRGRGGSGFMVPRLLDVLDGTTSSWNKPVVGLIDRHSRSAKEVLAYDFQKRALGSLVGERTAGAVIPVTLTDVGFGMSLMFPSFTMGDYTDKIEFKGVAPDLVVSEVGPYSAGADPIFEAGIREAVRLCGASLEAWRARRQAAAGQHETMHIAPKVSSANQGVRARVPEPKWPKEPDQPGYDARATDVWAKMVDALGGEAAMRRHTYRTMHGKRNMGGMMEATIERIAAAPNLRVDRMELGGMGKAEQGYNGEIAWSSSQHEGTRKLSGKELEDAKADADFYALLHPKENHRSIIYVGQAEVDGRRCDEIRMTKKSGDVETYYIEAATYLPIGWVGTVPSNMGPLVMRELTTQFKRFDGELVGVARVADVGGMQEMTTTITDVTFNTPPEGTFDPPKELVGD